MENFGKAIEAVTFNIRCDFGQDGENRFDNRKDGIKRKIEAEKPDIIGFQEAMPHVVKWICDTFPEYVVLGCGREYDLNGEHVLCAVRKDMFRILQAETFWLSPTPTVPGSRYYEQSTCPRTCMAVLVQYKGHETPFYIYVTHLDHEGAAARRQGIELVLKRIHEQRRPAILLADLNAEPRSTDLLSLRDSDLIDVTDNIATTFHNFEEDAEDCKIDYIYTTKDFECLTSYIWDECENGIFLSDHYPVSAKLTYSQK